MIKEDIPYLESMFIFTPIYGPNIKWNCNLLTIYEMTDFIANKKLYTVNSAKVEVA